MISIGDKVWVWHSGSLKEIEVTGITELNKQKAVLYTGHITINFFVNRNQAIEHRLSEICSLIQSLKKEKSTAFDTGKEETIRILISLAEQTQIEVRNCCVEST